MGKQVVISCAICGLGTGPVSNHVPDGMEDDDPHVPPGWLAVTVQRVVPNPEHAEYLARREGMIGAQTEQVKQQAAAQGQVITDAEAREAAGETIDLFPVMADEPPPFLVEEIGPEETPDSEDAVFYLCMNCAGALAKTGGEFEEAFGNMPGSGKEASSDASGTVQITPGGPPASTPGAIGG